MQLLYFSVGSLRARLADKRERGQGLAEYGLILALVAVVAIAALTGLGQGIVTTLQQIVGSM